MNRDQVEVLELAVENDQYAAPDLAPLMFLAFGIASWALRPADRRLQGTRLRRDGIDRPQTGTRAWAVAVGLLVVLYVVSFLTLPVVEQFMHERAVELGWISA